MKNQLLLLTIFWMGSLLPMRISAVEMTSQTIEYLDAYGKVWGFLKYTNPQLDSESWNQVLLNDYDNIKQIQSDEQFSLLLDKLFQTGETPQNTSSKISTEQLHPSQALSWMNSRLLGSYKGRIQKIARGSVKGGIDQSNIKEFKTEATRYWAWCVAWNVLNYEDPNLALSTTKWNQLFSTMLPSFVSSIDGPGVYTSLEEAIENIPMVQLEINDHEYHQSKRRGWASFTCIEINGKIYVDQTYGESLKNDIRRGDQILMVNQQPVKKALGKGKLEIIDPKKFYGNIKELPQRLYLSQSPSELTIVRQGETINKIIHPAFTAGTYCDIPNNVNTELVPESSIYIKVATLEDHTLPNKFTRKYLSKNSVILDLRNLNKGENQSIKEHFISQEKEYCRKGRINKEHIGTIIYTNPSTQKMASEQYKGKLIILVDNTTDGNLQELIMTLQANNDCTVVGRPIGQNKEAYSTYKITDNISLEFPTEKRCYPNGESVYPQGINIDIMVPLTETYFKNVDEILYKALMITKG